MVLRMKRNGWLYEQAIISTKASIERPEYYLILNLAEKLFWLSIMAAT